LQAPAGNFQLLMVAFQFGLLIHSLNFKSHSLNFKVTEGSQGGLLGLLETQYPQSQPLFINMGQPIA
jgi:hypothetical protein